MTTDDKNPEQSLSIEKAGLENEKLRLEIKKLKRPTEIRLQYWNLGVTIFIAAAGLYSGIYLTRLYDIKSETLNLRWEKLDREITIFQGKRDSLLSAINYLQDSITKITTIKDQKIDAISLRLRLMLMAHMKPNVSKNDEVQFYKAQLDSLNKIINSPDKAAISKQFPPIVREKPADPTSPVYRKILNSVIGIKKRMEDKGFTLFREASLSMKYDDVVQVPLSLIKGKTYHFVFVPEITFRAEMKFLNHSNEEIFKKESVIMDFSTFLEQTYTPEFSNVYFINLLQILTGENATKEIVGYFMVFEKISTP